MKKSILPALTFLILLIPTISFSQLLYDSGIYSGKYVSSYPNGNKKAIGKLNRNQRVGTWEFYTENGELAARINYISNTEFETVETHNHSSISLKVPLKEYDRLFSLPLEEKTVVWAKRVHRDIKPYEFKLSPDFNFFQYLKTIQTDKALYFADDEFKTQLKNADSIPHSQEPIVGYRIKLDYFFRTDFNFMDFRIVGIAPLYQTSDGKTGEICWLYYHGLKDLVFEQIVNKDGESIESILQTKNYRSTIYKESNVADKTLEEISKDEEERMSLYKEIDNSILEIENDLIIKRYF
jgi:hypothetical protein